MKIQNISNTNFKANFVISQQADEYSFSKRELKKALTEPESQGRDLLDFLAYIYSKEGQTQLDRLPEEDTVELLLFDQSKDGNPVLDPYFFYNAKSLSEKEMFEFEELGLQGEFSKVSKMQKTFKNWIDNIAFYMKK